jgi:ATP-dependent Zn protease
MMSKSKRDQRGAAFHEAGHAVVAWVLGLAIGRVEIAIGADDAKGEADIEDAVKLSLLDQLAICAAGLEAQELFDAPTHEGAGWGDYGQMVELLKDLSGDEQLAMLHNGHQRAFDLVAMNRAKIERIATALIEKKCLGTSEIESLLAD